MLFTICGVRSYTTINAFQSQSGQTYCCLQRLITSLCVSLHVERVSKIIVHENANIVSGNNSNWELSLQGTSTTTTDTSLEESVIR